MSENIEKYVEIGRERIAVAKAADEAKEAAAQAERMERNRIAWLGHLKHVYAVLPEDLHGAVAYDASKEPTYYNGGSYHSQPVSLNCEECAPIQVGIDGAGCNPRFAVLLARKIAWFEDTPYINYVTGAVYTDPLMAIAEAYNFGPGNAEMEGALFEMEQAIAADPDIAERLQSVLAQSLADLPAPIPNMFNANLTEADIIRRLQTEINTPEPAPSKTTELLEQARRLYLDDDNQGAIAAALIAIAELLADDRPLPF